MSEQSADPGHRPEDPEPPRGTGSSGKKAGRSLFTSVSRMVKAGTTMRGRLRKKTKDSLDEGLRHLSDRLGLQEAEDSHRNEPISSQCAIVDAADCPRLIIYCPDMDGQVDPGEVVWFWAPEEAHSKMKTPCERAMVVIARHGSEVLGLLTSSNVEHSQEATWLDIGAGPWDELGRQSWVRLDKIIKIPETAIRRQGAVIPEGRFERIAIRLRSDYGWV